MVEQADNFAPDLADKLINRFGTTATFILPSVENFDEIEGESIDRTVTNTSATITPPLKYKKQIENEDILLKDSSISYFKGSETFTPKVGMRFTLSGVEWSIVRVDPLISGAKTAAYRLWVES